MILDSAVAVAVALAFVFAVAVAVTDTFRMGGDHESYPSLSFGEYNSRKGSFFTPLVYFLAGHYLDP